MVESTKKHLVKSLTRPWSTDPRWLELFCPTRYDKESDTPYNFVLHTLSNGLLPKTAESGNHYSI